MSKYLKLTKDALKMALMEFKIAAYGLRRQIFTKNVFNQQR